MSSEIDFELERYTKIKKMIEETYNNTHLFRPFSNFLFYLMHPREVVKFAMVGLKMSILYNAEVGRLCKVDDKQIEEGDM